jgi:hypothetical protein
MEWSGGKKNLSFEDREFLAASETREKRERIIAEEKEAQLERERKNKEAAEQAQSKAEQMLKEAEKKSNRRLRIGGIMLIISLLAAGYCTWQAQHQFKQAKKVEKELEELRYIVKIKDLVNQQKQVNSQLAESINVRLKAKNIIANEQLKQAWLQATIAEAYFAINESDKEAKNMIAIAVKSFRESNSAADLEIVNQVGAFVYYVASKIFDEQEYYKLAYEQLKLSKFSPYDSNIATDILTDKDAEKIYYNLIQSKGININSEKDKIAQEFRTYLYDGLEYLLLHDRLRDADIRTDNIMLYIAKQEREGYLTDESLQNFS